MKFFMIKIILALVIVFFQSLAMAHCKDELNISYGYSNIPLLKYGALFVYLMGLFIPMIVMLKMQVS